MYVYPRPEMTVSPTRVLVIDDEQHQLDTICRGLLLQGYRCSGVLGREAALDALTKGAGAGYDVVLTDLTLRGRAGLGLIDRIRRDWPDLPIVVITGLAASVEVGTVRERNISLLPIPFDADTLDATVRRALGGESSVTDIPIRRPRR
jgi:DNA-binding NtrC family response regulator